MNDTILAALIGLAGLLIGIFASSVGNIISKFFAYRIFKKESKLRLIEQIYKEKFNVYVELNKHINKIKNYIVNWCEYKKDEHGKELTNCIMDYNQFIDQYRIYLNPMYKEIMEINTVLDIYKIKEGGQKPTTDHADESVKKLDDILNDIVYITHRVTAIQMLDNFIMDEFQTHKIKREEEFSRWDIIKQCFYDLKNHK
ncbi:MAG TPA: VTT domain-containing protein [Methanosarcina sp.]|nr:VTT domain-containing protein [Methanosarcina sp.]